MTLVESLEGFNFESFDYRIVILSSVMLVSGFVSGLTGFGFSFFGALGLFFFQPTELVPLLLLLSTITQVTSMWSLRKSMVPLRQWWSEGPLAFIVGGAFGVPAGLWLLYNLDPKALCELVGAIIVTYSTWSFFARTITMPNLLHAKARLFAGFLGGTVGGFTAAPGSAIVVWGTLTGLTKERQRAIVQPFILCIQLLTIVWQLSMPGAMSGVLVLYALMLCLFLIPANQLGVMAFRKINDVIFKRLVLLLLAGMGAALIQKGFHVWDPLIISLDIPGVITRMLDFVMVVANRGTAVISCL